MFHLVFLLGCTTVAFAADESVTPIPNFFTNPDLYKYQQYNRNYPYRANNPFYGNNYYQANNRYNQPNYFDRDYQNRYYQDNYYNKKYTQDYQKYYQDGQHGILRFVNDANPDGSYQYSYETQNGIAVEEQGAPRPAADQTTPVVVQGFYRYTSPEGVPVEVRYTADEFGFHPEGNVIPGKSPLAYNAAITPVQVAKKK